MMRVRMRTGLIVMMLALTTGCAGEPADEQPTVATPEPSPTAPAPATPAPSTAPTTAAPRSGANDPADPTEPPPLRPSPRPMNPSKKPATGGPTEVIGVVTAGVEGGGCLMLAGYLLLNPNPRVVREGARVRVTGEVRTDMVTTCQQGTPFMIETAEPA
jgi:hypothetical protein